MNSLEQHLLDHLLAPVAHVENVQATARVQYASERATVPPVGENGEGVHDETPDEQSETLAEESFAAVRNEVRSIEEEITCRWDTAEAILDSAAAIDRSAIDVRPRGGSRPVQFSSGDSSLGLLTEADPPVISHPGGTPNEQRR